MANNPLYPGYSPKKEDEASINPLYPGYYSGEPLRNKPKSKNFIKPAEFNIDTIIAGIDEVANQFVNAPLAGPRWIKERIIDDWKNQLKVSVSSSHKLDPTELDDYAVEDFPGVTLDLSLNPDDWGLNPKDDSEKRKEKFKKQLKKTINKWTKETTGIDPSNLLKPDFADFRNMQEEWAWTRAMGYGDTTKDLSTTEDLTVKSVEGHVTAPHQDYWEDSAPINLKGVDVRVKRIVDVKDPKTKKVIKRRQETQGFSDIYKETAHAVAEFENQKGNQKNRDKKFNAIMENAPNAVSKELEHYYLNSNDSVKKIYDSNSGALAFFETQKEIVNDIYDKEKKIKEEIAKIKGAALKGKQENKDAWDSLKKILDDAGVNKDKKLQRVTDLYKEGRISEEAYKRFAENSSIYDKYLKDKSSIVESAAKGKISSINALKIISDKGVGRKLTETETLNESVVGKFKKGMENSILGTREGDIGKLLRSPELKAAGIDLRARALIPIIDRTRQDRIYNTTLEVLDAWDSEKLLERYAWKTIRQALPERLEAFASGNFIGERLKKTNYFGLKVTDEGTPVAGIASAKTIEKFNKKFGYNVSLKLDSGVFGIDKIQLKGGDKQFDLLKTGSGTHYFDFRDNSENALFSRLLNENFSPDLRIKVSDIIAKKQFGMSYNNLDATQKKQINAILFGKLNSETNKREGGGLFGKAQNFRDWSNKKLGDRAGANSTALLFKEIKNKNDSLSKGYKLVDREYIGRLERLHSKMQDLQNKISKSFIGEAVRFINNWKDILAKKAAELATKLISKLISNFLGIAAASTGFLAVLMPIIKAVAEKVIKKVLMYGEAALKALIKWDFDVLRKMFEKDMRKVFKLLGVGCACSSLAVLLPAFLVYTVFSGSTSSVDRTRGSTFGEQSEHYAVSLGTCILSEDVLVGIPGWYYSQCDPVWSSIQIDSSKYSVGNSGCTLTTIAMVYKYFGYECVTPEVIANIKNQFNNNGEINSRYTTTWDKAINGTCIPDGSGIVTVDDIGASGNVSDALGALTTWFQNHSDGIVSFGMVTPPSNQHWVILKWDGDKIIIIDPYPTNSSPAVSDFPGKYGGWSIHGTPTGYYCGDPSKCEASP